MSNGKQLTKKQHFIPRVYLRGFSIDDNNITDNDKKRINYYDLINDEFKTDVKINTQCCEKNIYELTDEKGDQILPNYLEKALGLLEIQFPKYRDKLRGKAFIDDNYKTKSFLTHEEKVFWIVYMTLQLMRDPQILKATEEATIELLNINTNQARNIARQLCLPLFNEINENSPESKLIDAFMNPMLNMSFAVCVDKEARFITSDKPVNVYSEKMPCKEYDFIIFPISAELCLLMFGGEEKGINGRNNLLPITDEIREIIFCNIVDNANDKIFLNHKTDKKEKTWIREVMNNKKKLINTITTFIE